MKKLLLPLFLIAATAHASEPGFNMAALSHNLDSDTDTLYLQSEFGDRFHGHVRHSRFTNDGYSTAVAIGMHWRLPANLLAFARLGYLNGHGTNPPPGERDEVNQRFVQAGIEWGFAERWESGVRTTYSDNDNYFGDYTSAMTWLKVFPFDNEWAIGVIAQYQGWDHNWAPSIYLSYNWE